MNNRRALGRLLRIKRWGGREGRIRAERPSLFHQFRNDLPFPPARSKYLLFSSFRRGDADVHYLK